MAEDNPDEDEINLLLDTLRVGNEGNLAKGWGDGVGARGNSQLLL